VLLKIKSMPDNAETSASRSRADDDVQKLRS
jgi:hypothetical protein